MLKGHYVRLKPNQMEDIKDSAEIEKHKPSEELRQVIDLGLKARSKQRKKK